ncbi:thermonuclease family protein [Oleidesulfovibrio sp.]|uniref:thermonuclease family protein n=1 Tax=Oleidesulfovibrio sp. TaxID=2909707 RepID=UPI003A8A4F66
MDVSYKRGKILCLCAGLCVLLFAASVARASDVSFPVRFIPDGDTVVMLDGRSVRLAGIDAPEMPRDGKTGGLYSVQSRDVLRKYLAGGLIVLNMSNSGKDRFGRIVGEGKLPDGTSLNEVLVRDGAAWFYYHDDVPEELSKRLLRAQKKAIGEKRGMWALVQAFDTAEKGYRGNKRSKRFFSSRCDAFNKISYRNRVHFDNLIQAFLHGMAPARSCSVWPAQP